MAETDRQECCGFHERILDWECWRTDEQITQVITAPIELCYRIRVRAFDLCFEACANGRARRRRDPITEDVESKASHCKGIGRLEYNIYAAGITIQIFIKMPLCESPSHHNQLLDKIDLNWFDLDLPKAVIDLAWKKRSINGLWLLRHQETKQKPLAIHLRN